MGLVQVSSLPVPLPVEPRNVKVDCVSTVFAPTEAVQDDEMLLQELVVTWQLPASSPVVTAPLIGAPGAMVKVPSGRAGHEVPSVNVKCVV
jgi:hypothetical protein